jgi:predicted nucleic acid-binding protein
MTSIKFSSPDLPWPESPCTRLISWIWRSRKSCAGTCWGGDLTPQRGKQALADLTDFPILRYPHDLFLSRIWVFRRNATAYDAAYLALAESLAAPLVTCDARLAVMSGHRAIVELVRINRA